MSRLFKRVLLVLFVASAVLFSSSTGVAQSAIEELAVQQISEETGIDPSELATLFVTDGPDQFIIAFVYITEATLESDLKPDLKEAVAPFVDKNAMLTLVVPTRASSFNPTEIAFVQENVTHLLAINQIHPITDDFFAGQLAQRVVSSGIIELPQSLDLEAQFDIVFRGEFSTPFSIGVGVVEDDGEEEQQSGGIFGLGNFLLGIIQFLLVTFLIPFLILI